MSEHRRTTGAVPEPISAGAAVLGAVRHQRENECVDELWTTACHEAGHATVAHLLGGTIGAGPITITPGMAFTGVCFFGRAASFPKPQLSALALPYVLLPSQMRRFYEIQVMSLLGGGAAAEMYAGRGEPTRVDLTEPGAEPEPEVMRVSEPLPDREAVVLERAAVADSHEGDLAKAWKILSALHEGDEKVTGRAAAYLESETELLLSGPKAQAMVLALASELMAYRTLAAAAWQAVLRKAAA